MERRAPLEVSLSFSFLLNLHQKIFRENETQLAAKNMM